MAMIKCKDCGKEYSDRADKCPGCGNIPDEYIQPKKSNDFNVGRFKIIVALYVVCFMVLCTILPMNTYFQGNEYESDSYTYVDDDVTVRSYGIKYNPIWKVGEEEKTKTTLVGYPELYTGVYKGNLVRSPNIFILIIELVSLTVLFTGISYISCVRKKL